MTFAWCDSGASCAQHSGWERPETGRARNEKTDTRNLASGESGASCSPGRRTRGLSASTFIGRSHSRSLGTISWGVWSSTPQRGVKLGLCGWSGTSWFVSMEMEAGEGASEPVPPQECRQEGAVRCSPGPGAGSGPCPPGCCRGGGGISNRGPSDGSVMFYLHLLFYSLRSRPFALCLTVSCLFLPRGFCPLPLLYVSSLFSILMLEILSDLAFKFPRESIRLVSQLSSSLKHLLECFAYVLL